jgi:hypothetical protein
VRCGRNGGAGVAAVSKQRRGRRLEDEDDLTSGPSLSVGKGEGKGSGPRTVLGRKVKGWARERRGVGREELGCCAVWAEREGVRGFGSFPFSFFKTFFHLKPFQK